MSGEAASRAHLDLPGDQQQLLEAVVATGGPSSCSFLRPAAGARLGRSACACSHEGLVPGGLDSTSNRRHPFGSSSQRQANHELPPRCRAGAALL